MIKKPHTEWGAHDYWKMKIISMHKDVSGNSWVVGFWFYTPSQMRGIKLRDKYVFGIFLSYFITTYLYLELFSLSWEIQNLSNPPIGV
jgi:hypothetical protein